MKTGKYLNPTKEPPLGAGVFGKEKLIMKLIFTILRLHYKSLYGEEIPQFFPTSESTRKATNKIIVKPLEIQGFAECSQSVGNKQNNTRVTTY